MLKEGKDLTIDEEADKVTCRCPGDDFPGV